MLDGQAAMRGWSMSFTIQRVGVLD